MTTMPIDEVPLPDPFDLCYEWDGPYGTRKFSAASHNGAKPARSVALFNEERLRAYGDARAAAAVAAERERCAKLVETQDTYGDPVGGWFETLAAKIRAAKENP